MKLSKKCRKIIVLELLLVYLFSLLKHVPVELIALEKAKGKLVRLI
jgi:hypothetical protein